MIDEKKLMEYVVSLEKLYQKALEQFHDEEDFGGMDACGDIIAYIEDMPKVGEWIPCSERMPEEHEVSEPIFDPVTLAEIDVKYHTTSDLAQVTVKDEDGERFVYFDYTVDGKWFCCNEDLGFEVLAWQPMSEPWEGEENEN